MTKTTKTPTKQTSPARLGDLAELVGGRVVGDPGRTVDRITTLDEAGPADLSFVTSSRYVSKAAQTRAGALLVGPSYPVEQRSKKDLLVAEDPYWALAKLVQALAPDETPAPGVHPTAVVAESAAVDSSASVGAYAVIGSRSRIGPGCAVHAHVTIGDDCELGAGSVLFPQVVLYDRTVLGCRVIIHSGSVVGSDGYGFATHEGRHEKIPHRGRVVIEDDVEIGAGCTIDRAMFAETRVGRGTKVDNCVQIGHNSVVGEDCLLVSHTTLAGSVRLGNRVVMAGQSGVAGHLELGDDVQIHAMSAATRSIPAGSKIAGFPAIDARDWRRQQVLLRHLDDMRKRLRNLEKELELRRQEKPVD